MWNRRYVLRTVEMAVVFMVSLYVAGRPCLAAETVDLSKAKIVAVSRSLPRQTVTMLQEEVQSRSGVWLKKSNADESTAQPLILIGTVSDFPNVPHHRPKSLTISETADAFAVWVDTTTAKTPRVCLMGNDGRGALFAVGWLLRKLKLSPGRVELNSTVTVSRSPAYAIRGHQIGYRHTANTYDAWDVATYEQYLRDLILFGTNSVELIQEGGRGFRDGPVLQEDQWIRNVQLTQMIQGYGIDVWLWEPLRVDIADPIAAEAAMRRRAEFYQECAQIDHVMVPGGDPGHTDPKLLMPWLKKQAAVLHEAFPDAGLWVSHQKFNPQQMDYFFDYLHKHKPTWLAGVVFGPGTAMSLEQTRQRTPAQFPIRRYPDITHNVRCQYPVPRLDGVIAQTLGREGINPRPSASKLVHNLLAKYSDGFVSYSDGSHDDLNKMVWSALGWDEATDLTEVLDDYGRVFFGENLAKEVSQGLRMLEQNLVGAVRDNDGIPKTLAQWRKIEDLAGGKLDDNWRFQMYLFRAMFDAYIHTRHLTELGYEQNARQNLAQARTVGVESAIEKARAALAEADRIRTGLDLRISLEEKGAKLLRLIGFQLSIDEPYLARNPERGALLDKLDRPLNDRLWLQSEFARILATTDVEAQLAIIDRILNWEDPGPGGFYDDLGNAGQQPHLVRKSTPETDPGYVRSPMEAHYRSMNNSDRSVPSLKWSWLDYAQGTPLQMRYTGLEKDAEYRLRITYHGRFAAVMRLTADETYQIHDALPMPVPVRPVEFDVPHAATQDGTLQLQWDLVDRRGCQVAEVWLMRR